jgi:hypothetical protein
MHGDGAANLTPTILELEPEPQTAETMGLYRTSPDSTDCGRLGRAASLATLTGIAARQYRVYMLPRLHRPAESAGRAAALLETGLTVHGHARASVSSTCRRGHRQRRRRYSVLIVGAYSDYDPLPPAGAGAGTTNGTGSCYIT